MNKAKSVLIFDHMLVIESYKLLYKELRSKYGINLLAVAPSYATINFQNDKRVYSIIRDEESEWMVRVKPVVPANPHRVLYNPLQVLNIILRNDWDTIFIAGEPDWFVTFEIVFLSRLAKRRAKIIVQSSRNIDFEKVGFPYKAPLISSMINTYVRRRIFGIACIGETSRMNYDKEDNPNTLFVLPFAFDGQFYCRRATNLGRDSKSTLTVGFVGRITLEKGVETFALALSMLRSKVHVRVVGSGPHSIWLREKLMNTNHTVEFVEAVSTDEMPMHYSSMDILVVPSVTTNIWREQFGRVLVEAMLCEVAVIGSSSGEIPYVIGDAGLIFCEGDAAELASKIDALCSDSGLLQSLKLRGRDRALKEFSIESVARKFNEMLSKG